MKLTREDWSDAAYKALLRGGPRAVAVAILAEDLDATRGSFYHYFKDRDELLVAALERWEQKSTEIFIDRASSESEPGARLRNLFSHVFQPPTDLAAVERRLLAERVDNAQVAQVVDRVIARRHAFLVECYLELGHNEIAAEDRAAVAYLVFTGWLHLDQSADEESAASTKRLAALVQEMLLPAA